MAYVGPEQQNNAVQINDLDLFATFDRFVSEALGWGQIPNAITATALVYQLFCLMLWQNDDRSVDTATDDPRASKLRAFFDRLFSVTEHNHVHMLITRGLSYLNYLSAPPIELPSLDLGCESGLTSKLLFDKPFTYGVDLDAGWAPHIGKNQMHHKYRLGSADAIPLPDASVRSVVMNNVLYHVSNREKVLKEIFRCLQPGGRVYFDDLSPDFFDDGNRPFINFLRDSGGRNFAHEYTRKRLTMYMGERTINPFDMIRSEQYPETMSAAGFTNVSAKYFHNTKLLRLAYNFLDMGFIFGCGAVEPKGESYRVWAKTHLLYDLLQDATRCRAEESGGYIFVTAAKPE
jgi:SAM-dependent methyltransferase